MLIAAVRSPNKTGERCKAARRADGSGMSLLETERLGLCPLVTHRSLLDSIGDAYDLFANQRDGVLKVAITP